MARPEIIKFDIHPVAEMLKKEFKNTNETFANYYFHNAEIIDEESFKIYYYDYEDNVYDILLILMITFMIMIMMMVFMIL